MIPTLQHTQPLLKDLSVQPEGRYLLTVYGATSRRYLYVDDVYVYAQYMEAFRIGVPYPIVTLPIGTLWTVVASECLEFPTLEEISRQSKQDGEKMTLLERELYPNKGNEAKEPSFPGAGEVIFLNGLTQDENKPPTGQYL